MLELRGELHGTTSAGLRTSRDLSSECWKRSELQGETPGLDKWMLKVRGELHGITSASLRTSWDLSSECWKRGKLQD